jgi:hypothetical protein
VFGFELRLLSGNCEEPQSTIMDDGRPGAARRTRPCPSYKAKSGVKYSIRCPLYAVAVSGACRLP